MGSEGDGGIQVERGMQMVLSFSQDGEELAEFRANLRMFPEFFDCARQASSVGERWESPHKHHQ
jgi:hypothetical protein